MFFNIGNYDDTPKTALSQAKQSNQTNSNQINQTNQNDGLPRSHKKWNIRKRQNMEVAYNLHTICNEQKAYKIASCSDLLLFIQEHDNKLKLYQTYFCKDRICPICNWRKSMKITQKMNEWLQSNLQDKDVFLLMTLTIKNCELSELRKTVDCMNDAFIKIMKSKRFKIFKGYIKFVEVAYNKKEKTAHPHLHVLLLAPSTYFKGSVYLSTQKITEAWKQALRIDYTPICDIRKVKEVELNDKQGFAKLRVGRGIQEVLKYSYKIEDIQDKDFLQAIITQLANTKKLSTGGVFKGIFKDTNKLTDIDVEGKEINKALVVKYVWSKEQNRYVMKGVASEQVR